MAQGNQLEFGFSPSPEIPQGGYSRWLQERRAATDQLSRDVGLPLGHPVHVALKDGTELDGVLTLADETLWVADALPASAVLRIHRCTFTVSEVQSCVRRD